MQYSAMPWPLAHLRLETEIVVRNLEKPPPMKLTLVFQLELFLLKTHKAAFQPPSDTFQCIDFGRYFFDFN